jgi:hypothetical protein
MMNFWHAHHQFLTGFIGALSGSLMSTLFFRKRLKEQSLKNQNSARKVSPLSIWSDGGTAGQDVLVRKEQ